VLGAAILKGLTPVDLQGSLGQTTVSPHLSPGQAFGIELVITFVLLFAGSASYDEHRTDIDGSRALATGISITICHMFAVRCLTRSHHFIVSL
jgi:glycerol uptake facilitator-like aquaporin